MTSRGADAACDALLLDFDGLIVDTEDTRLRAWAAGLRDLGVDLDLDAYIEQTFLCEGASSRRLATTLLRGSGVQADVDQLLHTVNEASIQLATHAPIMPGVTDLLASARSQRVGLAVVSDSPRQWVSLHLDRLGIRSHFDVVTCRDHGGTRKPSPEAYRLTAERLGVSPGRCLAIEDAPFGVEAARRAGIACVAVPNPPTATLDFPHAAARAATLRGHTVASLWALVHETATATSGGR